LDRPRYLHTEPPIPPPGPEPENEPVPQPPMPPGSPFPGKPQDDPPRGPPDEPLRPPAPIITEFRRDGQPPRHPALLVALLLALAPLGHAAEDWAAEDQAAEELDPQDRPAAFQQLDADGDGWISVEEAAAHPEVAANFQKADRDQDGRLSLEEFEAVALNRSDQPGKFRNPDRG
jgi:hypothetical protein